MMAGDNNSWLELNQIALVREFQRLRAGLGDESVEEANAEQYSAIDAALKDRPAAIDVLTEIFGLTVFERDVLLLCAGAELDSALAVRCASRTGARWRRRRHCAGAS
jgi:hypothetical protein